MAEPTEKPYKDLAFTGAWSGRSRGFWGVGLVGLIFGAGLGLVAPFIPILVGAQTLAGAGALVPASLAIFSAIGMAAGSAAGAIIGASSGGAAAVADEQERREKIHTQKMEKKLGLPSGSLTRIPEPEKTSAHPSSFKNTLNTYFNAKVGLVFTGIGALAGLVMAAAYFALGGAESAAVPAMKLLLGQAASNTTAVVTYFAGVMAGMGAMWSMNAPLIATNATRFMGDLISGKKLGTQWGPAPEPAKEEPVQDHIAETSIKTRTMPATARSYQSYQELATKKTDPFIEIRR